MPEHILVVEDEQALAETLRYNLEKEGYRVSLAREGDTALELARTGNPALILLDVMLPGISGYEVCRIVRKESTVPILMLTARAGEVDRVVGLDLGADDYIAKPFSMRELLARIRAALRRASGPAAAGPLVVADLALDESRHEIRCRDVPLHLAPREYDLLKVLMRNARAVVTRNGFLEQVWGADFSGDERTLDTHVRWVRGKLAAASSRVEIATVRGVGYRLDPPS